MPYLWQEQFKTLISAKQFTLQKSYKLIEQQVCAGCILLSGGGYFTDLNLSNIGKKKWICMFSPRTKLSKWKIRDAHVWRMIAIERSLLTMKTASLTSSLTVKLVGLTVKLINWEWWTFMIYQYHIKSIRHLHFKISLRFKICWHYTFSITFTLCPNHVPWWH